LTGESIGPVCRSAVAPPVLLAGVAAFGDWIVQQVEYEHFALPDRIALEVLVYPLAADELLDALANARELPVVRGVEHYDHHDEAQERNGYSQQDRGVRGASALWYPKASLRPLWRMASIMPLSLFNVT